MSVALCISSELRRSQLDPFWLRCLLCMSADRRPLHIPSGIHRDILPQTLKDVYDVIERVIFGCLYFNMWRLGVKPLLQAQPRFAQ